MFKISQLSLRYRLFFSMVFLIVVAFAVIASVTIYQYREETLSYNKNRFERKEEAALLHLNQVLNLSANTSSFDILSNIDQAEINNLASVHRMHIKLFNEEGILISASDIYPKLITVELQLSKEILKQLKDNGFYSILNEKEVSGNTLQRAYSTLSSENKRVLGYVKLQLLQDNSVQEENLKTFLSRMGWGYLLVFVLAIGIALLLSKFITGLLETIINQMQSTDLDTKNQKIQIKHGSKEIKMLIEAYNNMVDALEDSAVRLASSERENAWKEMAKQVAHEIKNPLTPMRLSVQSFERKFKKTNSSDEFKVSEFCESLIQQIDLMSSIATAFSDFASMPAQRKEDIELIQVVKMALDIFDDANIQFTSDKNTIKAQFDKSQLIRIITNIVKNAIQATEHTTEPHVEVHLSDHGHEFILQIKDNGEGISDENIDKVFEPKFTTKTKGMGLGLPIIKKIIDGYGGHIHFKTKPKEGTTFFVRLPKDKDYYGK